MALAKKVINQNGAIRKFEKPEVCEAIKVANANRWTVALSPTEWDEREARLNEEHKKNIKAPGPDEEQPEEKIRIICCSASPKADFYYKHVLNEGNPALKESASQFNDALLDEQAKKIEKLTEENERLKDQVAVLYACKENNEKYNLKQIKRLGKEIAKLNGIIHDKNAVLADVAEELRLSKIREKNLTEVCQKYMKENEELKKELADKVVDKIDAQALKSADSALAWKEKVVTYKDMALAYYEKKIAEKDEVIADLGNELAATKKELEEKAKLVEVVRKNSKEFCDYCIAAEKMIQKMAKEFVNDEPVSSKDYEQYRLWAKGYRFIPQLPDFSEEEEKSAESALAYKDEVIETLNKELAEAKHELSSLKRPFRPDSTEAVVLFANAYAKAEKKHLRCAEWRNDGKEVSITYILKNGKKSKITLDFTGDEIIFSRTDPDKKPRIPTPEEPKHDNSREDFIKKTIDGFNIKAVNLGSVGSNDGNGIIDQMVGVDIAEEGGDHSGVTVLCGKDFVKKFKENGWFDFSEKKYEEIVEELSKVTDETFDQFLQFGEIIIKSEK